MTPVARRTLKFHGLDEVVRDVEELQAKGYTKAGNWDLAQVCGHLSDWMRYPVEGYPKAGCLIGLMLWLMKVTIGKSIIRKVLATGAMRAGGPTMKQTVYATGADVTDAVKRLRETAERFKEHSGEYFPSPMFGFLTRDDALKLQLAHCAHHLSFLIPKAA